MIILALYTNMSKSPNIIIRLAYLGALLVPLLKQRELLPVVLISALGISYNTFAYPFMPTEDIYYIILSVIFLILSLIHRKFRTSINPLFIIILIYLTFSDLIFQGFFSNITFILFLFISFFFCTEYKIDKIIDVIPYSFIIISLSISYWLLFCDEAQIRVFHSVGDMESTGWKDPNYLGFAVSAGLILSVNHLLKNKMSVLYIINTVTVILSTVALLELSSRGALVAAALGILSLVTFTKTKLKIRLLVLGFIVIIVIFLFINQYFDLVIARFNADDGTGSNRTTIWFSKIDAFINDSSLLHWLFGHGQEAGFKMGTFKLSVTGSSTHNDFISIFIYYGIIGVILFIKAIIYPLSICSSYIRGQIIALYIFLLVSSMTIEPLAQGNIVYLGFLFYIFQLARQSRKS